MSGTYSMRSEKEKWLQNVNSEIQGENTYLNKDNIKLDIRIECTDEIFETFIRNNEIG
jgi:hypothetical protein